MPRVTKAQLLEKAKELGVEVEFNQWAHHVEVVMEAGPRRVFAGTHTHGTVNVGSKWSEAYFSAMIDLLNGLTDCDATECDVCEGL